ncbi:MAG: cation:dicarboxylase symporter family transporter [Campylobacterales bacterium]|nr:cation:dicarboxylase symporter family transporter [Campylobacterales bacterium]
MIKKIKKYSTTNTLVLLGILFGALFGSFFPSLALEQKMIGTAFIYFLKMLVVPLVFSSIFVAILGLGSIERLKSIGARTIGFYILTTALAVAMAIVAMGIFDIGDAVSSEGLEYAKASTIAPFSFEAMILSFIPTNIFASLSDGSMMQIIVFAVVFGIASLYLNFEEQRVLNTFFNAVSNAMYNALKFSNNISPSFIS